MRLLSRTIPHLPLLVLLGVSLVVKLFLASPERVFEPHDMAIEWLQSGQLRYMHLDVWHAAYQLPLYAWVVTLVYWAGLGTSGVMVFQIGCGTLSAWWAYRMVMAVIPAWPHAHRIAMATGVFTAFCPFLAIYQMRMIHPFALEMLLAIGTLLAAVRASQGDRWAATCLAVGLGLLLVLRPPLAALAFPYAPSILRTLIRSKAWSTLIVCTLLAACPLSYWLVRNTQLHGVPLLTTATGQNLWLGIQPATSGTAQLPDGESFVTLLPPDEQRALSSMSALEQSRSFTRKWADTVIASPGTWLRIYLVKLRNFWLFRPHTGVDHPGTLARAGIASFKLYVVLLLPLVLWSVVRHGGDVRRLFVAVLLYSLVHAAFYVESRHRLVVEPVLFALACMAVGGRSTTPRPQPAQHDDQQ